MLAVAGLTDRVEAANSKPGFSAYHCIPILRNAQSKGRYTHYPGIKGQYYEYLGGLGSSNTLDNRYFPLSIEVPFHLIMRNYYQNRPLHS